MEKPFKTSAAAREKWQEAVNDIARQAGAVLMRYYGAAANDPAALGTVAKDDNSPVTLADKASDALIVPALKAMTPHIPVISEENETPDEEKAPPLYWAVDPLDGTKEFIDRTGGFCIKIALIDNGIPVLGCIYCPAQDVLYYSRWDAPAFRRNGNAAPYVLKVSQNLKEKGALKILFNQKHVEKGALAAGFANLLRRGMEPECSLDGQAGLPRNMQVAEGLADMYADCGRKETLESGCGFSWDYAPDWIILKNAGGAMRELVSGREPTFEKPREHKNAYASMGSKSLWKKLFP